ncbi:hypothetical protein GCM10028856_10840 [Halopiger thermotolerans]
MIAVIENVDPMRLDLVLYDYVDPGALDTLVGDGTPITLSFRIERYHVTIDGNELTVRGE